MSAQIIAASGLLAFGAVAYNMNERARAQMHAVASVRREHAHHWQALSDMARVQQLLGRSDLNEEETNFLKKANHGN